VDVDHFVEQCADSLAGICFGDFWIIEAGVLGIWLALRGQAGAATDFHFDDLNCTLPRDTTLNDIINFMTTLTYCCFETCCC
jgi:hypothetical protein